MRKATSMYKLWEILEEGKTLNKTEAEKIALELLYAFSNTSLERNENYMKIVKETLQKINDEIFSVEQQDVNITSPELEAIDKAFKKFTDKF